MEYKENALTYDIYCKLRKSVDWSDLPKTKAENAIQSSIYTVTVFDNKNAVGMARLIGDGIYYIIVDVIVQPNYQRKGIGSNIIKMIIDFVSRETPAGGRSSIQLISEKDKEAFYKQFGFKTIPHEFCGSGMRKVIHK